MGSLTSSFIVLTSHRPCEPPQRNVVCGCVMNPILLIVILLLLFGGGGFYIGGPVYGGSALVLVLLICLIVYLCGGFRGGPKV